MHTQFLWNSSRGEEICSNSTPGIEMKLRQLETPGIKDKTRKHTGTDLTSADDMESQFKGLRGLNFLITAKLSSQFFLFVLSCQ
jgi:hypothetical protein